MQEWVPVLVVGVVSLMGPLLLASLNARTMSSAKREDWKREDAVREQAEEAAKLLVVQEEVKAKKVEEQSIVLEDQSKVLNQIHTLVNSNLTSFMEEALFAHKATLVLLKADAIREGDTISSEAQDVIATAERRVSELQIQINDRKKATIEANEKLVV